MESIDLSHVESSVRRRYESARGRAAVLGATPVLVLLAVALLLGHRPGSTALFGVAAFVMGTALLWYGKRPRRAVLPGVVAGAVPLTLALYANHIGHICTGDRCVMLCVPACAAGGVIAGLAIGFVARRGRHDLAFWTGASAIALCMGSMGCACVGASGVMGLAVGYAAGAMPALATLAFARRSGGNGPGAPL